MNEESCWELFSRTGAPEWYMLYRAVREERSCKTESK